MLKGQSELTNILHGKVFLEKLTVAHLAKNYAGILLTI